MWNFLFSTNTWLSFVLAERYYGGRHFVWCTPYFETAAQNGFTAATPPTSTPKEIYQSLALEVERNDRHSTKIKAAREGLRKGAKIRLNRGEITQLDFDSIRNIINTASVADFHPLLYIINYERVKLDLIEVPVERRAHPLSIEFQLEKLSRGQFDVLELPRMKV
jgi:hypothetical protein